MHYFVTKPQSGRFLVTACVNRHVNKILIFNIFDCQISNKLQLLQQCVIVHACVRFIQELERER